MRAELKGKNIENSTIENTENSTVEDNKKNVELAKARPNLLITLQGGMER